MAIEPAATVQGETKCTALFGPSIRLLLQPLFKNILNWSIPPLVIQADRGNFEPFARMQQVELSETPSVGQSSGKVNLYLEHETSHVNGDANDRLRKVAQ